MKYASLILAVFLAVGLAFADNSQTTSEKYDGVKVQLAGSEPVTTRSGGETCALATVISSLPYQDIASTATAIDNYNYVCPYSAVGGKDVVYKYTPTVNQQVTIDMCGSYFDTKVYVYASVCSGTPIACNDDYCSGPNYPYSYLSYLATVNLTAGVTYYIVVDGYSSYDYGTYDLKVIPYQPCVVTCPTGGVLEGEPVCGTNYVDTWNGGCNSTPSVFQTICPDPGTTSQVLCGQSGCYLYNGYSYRDTDWFTVYGAGGTMTATVRTEFPAYMFFLAPGCPTSILYQVGPTSPCVDASLSVNLALGQQYTIWVGPSVFVGVPCGSDYTLTLSGIYCPPTATEETSWGKVKKLYR
jgi:hypothetical protein